MATIDFYSESNKSAFYSTDSAQSVLISGMYTLESITFYLGAGSGATGYVYAEVYAITGTHGTNAKPTGDVLATSDAVDVATLVTDPSFGLIEFTFTGDNAIELGDGEYFAVAVTFDGTTYVNAGHDASSPTHEGNLSYSVGGVWYTQPRDLCFYLEGSVALPTINCSDIVSANEFSSVSVSDPNVSVVDAIVLAENVNLILFILTETVVDDSASLAEDVSVNIAMVTSVLDTVFIAESTSVYVQPPTNYYVSINEVVTVSEYLSVNELNPEVFDIVSISENISVDIITDIFLDEFEVVTIAEFVQMSVGTPIRGRELPPLYAPEARFEGSFGERSELNENAPFATGLGYCGSVMEANAPDADVEGICSFTSPLTMSEKAPVSTLTGEMGAVFEHNAPTAELEAESYSNHMELDEKAPTARGEASMYEEQTLSLNKKAPFWTIEAAIDSTSCSLNVTAPVWYAESITAYEIEAMSLDEKAPVAQMSEGVLIVYGENGTLDVNAPVATMLRDTGASDSDQAEMTDEQRLDDYILEYSS